ncbi:MAG: metallophosphoesterase [Planctomycetota bacterium]|nr:metallophosphoesterase [Planctomycetota bacterium]
MIDGDERPVLVLSDLHLGRTGMVERGAELTSLVEGASMLVVNGDVAELHVERWAEDAARELDRLRSLCRASGTRLVLLAGNHDPDLTDLRHLILAGGELLITHGDAVHEALAPWSDAAAVIRDRHREVLAAAPAERRHDLDTLFEACREAALAECEHQGDLGRPTSPLGAVAKPWKIAAITGFWWSYARRLDRFASTHAPTARVILAGHTHRAGVERAGRRTIVNTGCFGIPGPALGALVTADGLEVRRILRGRDRRRTLGTDAIHHDPRIRFVPADLARLSELCRANEVDAA